MLTFPGRWVNAGEDIFKRPGEGVGGKEGQSCPNCMEWALAQELMKEHLFISSHSFILVNLL